MRDDPFKMLGIDSQAAPEEIKAAFRRMAKKYHPDITGDSGEKFRRILLAYEQLTGRGQAVTGTEEGFDFYLKVKIDRERDKVQDLFDDLKDGILTYFNVDLPEFLNLFIELTPAEAARGGRVKLDLPLVKKCRSCYGFGLFFLKRCKYCGGTGEMEYRKHTYLDIPAGVEGGEKTLLRIDNLHLTVILRVR